MQVTVALKVAEPVKHAPQSKAQCQLSFPSTMCQESDRLRDEI